MIQSLSRNWWAASGSAAALLTIVVATGLPILFPALGAWWVRVGLVLLVLAGFAIAAAVRLLRGRKASDQIAEEIAQPSPGEAEDQALSVRMRDALAQLRTASGGRRDYLYSRPWYLMIGSPGAGKTTALVNSGLRFPYSDTALGGAGGTRNLDFWFADEAVLVDTAGRYTSQDSDAATDAAGWGRFLGLLRRARPLQPINGVLAAVPLDELMTADRAGIDAQATALRRRLAELRKALGVRAPVYLVLTKADLISGFTEFFDDLNAEGRRAVLGATLPLGSAPRAAGVVAEFDRLIQAMSARVSKRLQDEPDQRRRSLIIGFPSQLEELRARFARLVEGAFLSEPEPSHIFRGFYLASGVQEGAALDRVLSAMAEVYDEPHTVGRRAGRAYFLNRLLEDVAIPEAGLVEPEPAIRRRRRILLLGGTGAIALVAVAMIALWGGSFLRNRTLQDHLLAGGQEASRLTAAEGLDLVEVRDTDPDLEQALPLLNRLRALPRGFDDQAKGGPDWRMRLGLFQGGHAEAARQAYLNALQRVLLPRLLLRLEHAMREQSQTPIALYEPLKTYLMLGGYGPLDRAAVRAWVVEDWRTTSLAGPDRQLVRAQLGRHLDAMLADSDLGRAWPDRRAPLDGALIASTRAAVQTLSLADRAYAALRQRAAASGHADWRAEAALSGGDRRAFANGDAVLQLSTPWLFTKDGYTHAFLPGLMSVQTELDRDLWVLGPDAAKTSVRDQVEAMRPAVAADYARDYEQAWDTVLQTLQPADYFGDRAALGAFTRSPSPLKVLLQEVRRNTALGGGSGGAAAGTDAGAAISDHFKALADFVGGGSGPAPVDALVEAIRGAASANVAVSTPGVGLDGGAAQGRLAGALGDLSTAGASAPPQLQGFVSQATQRGRGAATRSAQAMLDQQYVGAVLPACRSATENRYPFALASTRDASPPDLQRVMAPNGQLDAFVRDRLQPLLDTSSATWRWRADDPVAARFDAGGAAQFQKAAAVRDLIGSGLAVNVSLADVGKDVTAAEFSAGGATYRFEAKSTDVRPAIWTLSALPAAHVVLYSGKRELKRFDASGPWALFRLMDSAAKANAGPSSVRATFGAGTQTASFRVDLPSPSNPFGRSGPWSFHCPVRL